MHILRQWRNMRRWQIIAEQQEFEALMGYLYLKEDYTRMLTLVRMGIGEDIL